jgi:type IV secretory pathway TraG/TraD family ATPase VirD4
MNSANRPNYLVWPSYEDGIHRKYGTEHFLVVGASGAGKTTLINALLKSTFNTQQSFRAMVYDPKQEMLPILYGLTPLEPARIRVLHPFDPRCCAWSVADDIDGPLSARQLASILLPETESGGNSDSFFTNAVRDLMTGVMLVFIKCVPKEGVWTFRDVILAMLYEPYLRFLLNFDRTRERETFPNSSRLRQSYLDGDSRTVSNIRATINSKLSIYEPVAAVWHKAHRSFSLEKWVEQGCQDILVLGNDEAARAAIDAVNQAIFKRATELLLATPEATEAEKRVGENQTWIFLDEVREAGHLDGLSRLLTKGRSKGACVVMGFQDIDGMRDAYGDEIAQEVCGQCNNVAVLKLNSPSTAEWASEMFGRRLARSRSQSRGLNTDGGMHMSRDAGEDERPWVYTSDLLYLPPTSEKNGLTGYFRAPDLDPEQHDLRVHVESGVIQSQRPQPHPDVKVKETLRPASAFSGRLNRDPDEHYLKPWDQGDWERLGLDKFTKAVLPFDAPPGAVPKIVWGGGQPPLKPNPSRSVRNGE